MRCARAIGLVLGVSACGGGQAPPTQVTDVAPLRALDDTRWSWTRATCDDGTHQLDALGFADALHVTAIGHGLRLTHTLQMATDGCAETIVTWVSADGAAFSFKDQVRVADAVNRACNQTWPREHTGELRHLGDILEIREYRSAHCGGYDIRHEYRRVTAERADDHSRIRGLVAGLVLRDPDVMTRDFAEHASLVVPKPARDGGGQLRFEGRTAARGWLTNTVRSVAWIGARILEIGPAQADAPGQYTVRIEYMDSALASPIELLLRVTLADGEIYEAQWLLASTITPRADTDAATPLPHDASLPDTGVP